MTKMSKQEKNKKIKQMVNSYKLSYLIMVAEKIGIFNHICEIPQKAEIVAQKLGVSVNRIEPILNALTFYQLISKSDQGYYLDEYVEQLNPNTMGNQINYIRFASGIMEKWTKIEDVVKNDTIAKNHFQELTSKKAEEFMKGMEANAVIQANYIIENYVFTAHTILDIGAGAGTYTLELCKKDPTVNAKMIDLPEIVTFLTKKIRENHLQNQITVQGMNYQKGFSGNYDDVFLFAVAHQENDENLEKLLANVYEVLKPKGRLFLTSFFLDEDKISPEFAVQFAIEMLVMSENGKVYTHQEIQNHIKKAGFSNITKIEEIPSPATLYIASKQ